MRMYLNITTIKIVTSLKENCGIFFLRHFDKILLATSKTGLTRFFKPLTSWLAGQRRSVIIIRTESQSQASIVHTMTNMGNTNGFEIIIIVLPFQVCLQDYENAESVHGYHLSSDTVLCHLDKVRQYI